MKTIQKEKTLDRDELAGRHGEGRRTTMKQTVAAVAVPPDAIIAQQGEEEKEKLYHRIFGDARRAGIYGGQEGDVAGETWLIAQGRGYYCRSMLREAARNMGLWRHSKEEEVHEALKIDIRSPEIAAIQAEVRAALWRLSSRCRAVVYMHYFCGYTLDEIAGATGESIGSVHACVEETKAALRLLLGGYAPHKRRLPAAECDLPLFQGVA